MLRTVILLALVALLGCGCLYSNIQRPLDRDFSTTELGGKEGRSNNHSVLWLFAWGDAGSRAAAESADIKVITHADQEWLVVLFGLYARYTTVVYGY